MDVNQRITAWVDFNTLTLAMLHGKDGEVLGTPSDIKDVKDCPTRPPTVGMTQAIFPLWVYG